MSAAKKTTRLKKRAILESLEKGSTVSRAAKAAGVHVATVYAWRNKDPKFCFAMDTLLATRIGTVEDALYVNAAKGNVTAQIFWLCNRCPDRWQNLHRVKGEFTGDMTHTVKANLGDLLKAARSNGHGITDSVERRAAFIGGTSGSAN